MEAASTAVAAKVPVHTISFGTPGGFVDRGGRPIQVPVDGQTLRAVAEETGGGFHEAGSSAELRDVYEDIGSSVGYRKERQDISARFIGLGLVLRHGCGGRVDALVLPPALSGRRWSPAPIRRAAQ